MCTPKGAVVNVLYIIMVFALSPVMKRRRHPSEEEPSPPILKRRPLERVVGTQIFCTRINIWEQVTGIKLCHVEDILSFEEVNVMSKFSFGWNPGFNATLSGIPYEITNADKEGQDRAASILCNAVRLLITKEPITIIPVTNEANPGISAEDSESGDEVAPSPAIPNPFSNIELGVVQFKYEKLHDAYHTALEANFRNAQGKVFVQELLAFLLPREVYRCEISTSPNGDEQPGALTVEWVTHKPSPLRSRIEESDAVKTQKRCADVIAYNIKKKNTPLWSKSMTRMQDPNYWNKCVDCLTHNKNSC